MRVLVLFLVALTAGCLDPVSTGPSISDDGPTVGLPAPADSSSPQATSPSNGADVEPSADHPANSTESSASHGGAEPTPPRPPRPIHWEARMGVVALPAFGPWSECGVPLTGCDGPNFRVEGTFDLEATLSWDLPTNDLDLFLTRLVAPRTYEEISRAGDNDATEPVTSQLLRYEDLPPGDYRLWVAPQHGIQIECELDVVFS